MTDSQKTNLMAIKAIVGLVLTAWATDLPAQDPDVADRGFALIKKYCYDCHGATFNGSSRFDLNDLDGLTKSSGEDEAYVIPGNPDESFMWQRVADQEMPPEDYAQPTDDEKRIIKAWIAAGVPKPTRREIVFRSEADVVKTILSDIRSFDKEDRARKRYFTLNHVANNPSVSEFELKLYRAALSKVINSLSRAEDIVIPVAIDEEGTVFRVDLERLRWNDRTDMWTNVLRVYPYGLKYDQIDYDLEFRRGARDLQEEANTKLAYVRADWFIVAATRGAAVKDEVSLYDLFLDIPDTDLELERRLGVDVNKNFLASPARLRRAGFDESGVSTGSRVVERHALGGGGYYWKSYDFSPGNTRSVLYRFALGPKFDGNEFGQRFAFDHDGGELIFSLPNGLQGYMLIDGKGNKIQEGPIKVVRDPKEIGGTPEVANAISCMHCHQHGMVRFEDSVRESLGIRGRAKEKALELYAPKEEMDRLVRQDTARFLRALDAATAPFLRVGEDANKEISQFAEPVGAVAKFFRRDISLSDASIELGIPEAKLKEEILRRDELQFLGLGPLAIGRKINRSAWQNKANTKSFSPYQLAAQELNIGNMFIQY